MFLLRGSRGLLLLLQSLLLLVALCVLPPTLASKTPEKRDDAHVFSCSGKYVILSLHKTPRRACVRWTYGATVGNLSATVAALSGCTDTVQLHADNIMAKLAFWKKRVDSQTPLDRIMGSRLKATAKRGSKYVPIDGRFLDLLPRVDAANLPLLVLQPLEGGRGIDAVKALLQGSPEVSPSWLQDASGAPVALLQPSNEALSLLFPNDVYRSAEFRNVEEGRLKHFPANIFSFPLKASAYYCGAKIPLRISSVGRRQLQEAFAEDTAGQAEINMLVSRGPRNIYTEQDPTVALIQWFRGPQNEAIMKETPIHVQTEEAPLLPANARSRYGRGFFRYFFLDNTRMLSRIGGLFARLRVTPCFVWRFAAMTNIDLEEAFSVAQTWPPGRRHFPNIGRFFSRPINTDVLRPVDANAAVVSPADSVLQNAFFVKPDAHGKVVGARVPQVKGTTFDLSEFLFGRGTNADLQLQSPNNRLYVLVYYLAPADYHRFHSAADWAATRHIYIPGCTPSVQRRMLLSRNVLDSFERTSVQGFWQPGNMGGSRLFFSMTFVAASMVGGIQLHYRRHLDKNKFLLAPACARLRKTFVYDYDRPVDFCMGQEMGSFQFGSTVVVAFEGPEGLDMRSPICSHVDVNSTAAKLPEGNRQRLPRCNFTVGNHDNPLAYLEYLQKLVGEGPPPVTGGTTQMDVRPHFEDFERDLKAGEEETSAPGPNGDGSLEDSGMQEVSDGTTVSTGQEEEETEANSPWGLENALPGESTAAAETQGDKSQRVDLQATIREDAAETVESVCVSDRPLLQQVRRRQVQGEEIPFSSLRDPIEKIKVLEHGFVHRFALSKWLANAWMVEEGPPGKRMLLLQVGQLLPGESDRSDETKPMCFYDAALQSVQLRFTGKVSNLLLMWPSIRGDPVLLRYPNFACASSSGWGKVTRGVHSQWHLQHGILKATFQLDVGRLAVEGKGEIQRKTFVLTGRLARLSDPESVLPAAGEIGTDLTSPLSLVAAAGDAGVLRFDVTEQPTLTSVDTKEFAVTTAVPEKVVSHGACNESSCFTSPIRRAWASLARWFRALGRRFRRRSRGERASEK